MTGERRLHRAVDIGGVGERDLGQWLAGSRVLHHQPAGIAIDPVAVDIVLPIILFQAAHDRALPHSCV